MRLPALVLLLMSSMPAQNDRDMESMAVRGRVEISRPEALISARDSVLERARDSMETVGARVRKARQPFWMPDFVAARAVDDWLADLNLRDTFEVVDRVDDVHDHEWGRQSYRTTFLVRPNAEFADASRAGLERRLRRARTRFLALGASTLGFWGGLTLILGWLNRLSRGYMSKRLGWIGVILGVAVPSIAFVL